MSHTHQAYHALTGFDQGILRKFLHGANITNAHAQHWSDSGSDRCVCVLCGQVDSPWHSGTTLHPSHCVLRSPLDTLSRCSRCQVLSRCMDGLSVPASQSRGLDSLPHSFPIPATKPPCEIFDLFTDGSCLFPIFRDSCISVPARLRQREFLTFGRAATEWHPSICLSGRIPSNCCCPDDCYPFWCLG